MHDAGQSIWLDYIDRTMLHNGDLERRISNDALTGMTSNPTIFQKALAEGSAYDAQIKNAVASNPGVEPWQLFELVETEDVRNACDAFADVYQETKGYDGYVSIEVSPGVAHDAKSTVEEAVRLWKTVNRPNVMVKVPGTEAGAAAIRELISKGINVNVTLLFSVDAYERVIDAYIAGLEDRAGAGESISGISSVASFFVSRVDSEIDKRLDTLGRGDLKGRAAIANAKVAYQLFLKKFSGSRWDALAGKGAKVQRPLWASTSTKNPAYRDVLYVEELIGPDTVNTMPPATLEAFRDHGETHRTVDVNADEAAKVLGELESAGVSIKDVTDKLLVEGLASFQKSFDDLIAGITHKANTLGLQPA